MEPARTILWCRVNQGKHFVRRAQLLHARARLIFFSSCSAIEGRPGYRLALPIFSPFSLAAMCCAFQSMGLFSSSLPCLLRSGWFDMTGFSGPSYQLSFSLSGGIISVPLDVDQAHFLFIIILFVLSQEAACGLDQAQGQVELSLLRLYYSGHIECWRDDVICCPSNMPWNGDGRQSQPSSGIQTGFVEAVTNEYVVRL